MTGNDWIGAGLQLGGTALGAALGGPMGAGIGSSLGGAMGGGFSNVMGGGGSGYDPFRNQNQVFNAF